MSSAAAPANVFLHHQGQQLGPYSLETAREMVTAGGLPPDVLAWHDGLPDWVPLAELLTPLAAPPAPLIASVAPVAPARNASFFSRLPGACVYPFKKDGLILLYYCNRQRLQWF